MYVLVSNVWFTKLMKQFFFWIDKIVFNFISVIYDVMISVARTSVFTQSDIVEMSDRIYKLLAIFMIFKVTLSLITYVVNPDDFSDKSKGVSKLGVNIVISMALLILTPYIFSYAYQFQTIILEDNSLGTLIFGGEEANESFFNTAGDKIAYITLTPFFSPNTSIDALNSCSTLIGDDKKFNKDCSGLNEDYSVDTNATKGMTKLLGSSDDFSESVIRNYVAGVENGNLGLMFRQDMAIAVHKPEGESAEFIMEYKFIFSTVTGIIIILLLITFCMDIAVRSIKLAFLQLVAPIPIISYVDPKSGKDGLFKKWYEMCIKTYLSLFVRLIALYFAVFIISKVADLKLVDIVDGSYVNNGIISILIIIGALMFAKQLPKMLEGLGIKLDGGGKFTLNPFKKFEEEAIGGKKILGLGKGLAAAGLASGAAFATNLATTGSRFKNAKGFLGKTGALFSSVGGAAGAARRGISGALKGEKFGKNFSNSYSGAMKAKHDRAQRNIEGIDPFERLGRQISNTMGISSYSDLVQGKVNDVEQGNGSLGDFEVAAKQKFGSNTDKIERLKKLGYMKKSNKELETEEKILNAKKSGAEQVKNGKSAIEGIVSKKQKVTEAQRFVDEVDSRKLSYYTDNGDLLINGINPLSDDREDELRNIVANSTGNEKRKAEVELETNEKIKQAKEILADSTATDNEKQEALERLAEVQKERDRKAKKDELDREIARALIFELDNPATSKEVNDVFGSLRNAVEATGDEDLKRSFEIINFDADGNLDFGNQGTEEKIDTMMSIIGNFGQYGNIFGQAVSALSDISTKASDVSDILAVRGVQTSNLRDSEKARRQAAIDASLSKK